MLHNTVSRINCYVCDVVHILKSSSSLECNRLVIGCRSRTPRTNLIFYILSYMLLMLLQRVRHSESATERQFTDIEDMTCTMRVWHKSSERPKSFEQQNIIPILANQSSSLEGNYGVVSSNNNKKECQPGPELIFKAMPSNNILIESSQQYQYQQPHLCCSADFGSNNNDPIPLSDRFLSFGSVDNHSTVSNRSGRGGGSVVSRSPRASFTSYRGIGGLSVCDNNDMTAAATPSRRTLGTTTIAVRDIVMISTTGGGIGGGTESSNSNNNKDPSELNRIHITTTSSGLFELTTDSTNGREVVIAFLKASMPKERVVMGNPDGGATSAVGGEGTRRDLATSRTRSGSTQHTQSSRSSFDVEAFTATRMSERLKSESLTEKVQRRIHRFVTSLDESK
jgi:hypothetical protein